MQNVKDAWGILNAGGTISNGAIEVTYDLSQLVCTPPCDIIPFNMDNIEDWEEVVEVGQLYCRHFCEGTAIRISTSFYPLDVEPLEGKTKMNEAFTREEILGL